MLPHSYELPAAVLLTVGGAVACFAGYRLFKIVLGIYGLFLGAWAASSAMGATNTMGMIVAAALGGIAGALILVFAYFVGIALIGAGLGAFAAHIGWSYVRVGDPPAAAVIGLAITGAVGAMLLQRYVIIVSTAFGGAWTMILGGAAIGAEQLPAASAHAEAVWILYPTAPAVGVRWVPIAWLGLAALGTAVQLRLSRRT
jgi:hypothetical protein